MADSHSEDGGDDGPVPQHRRKRRVPVRQAHGLAAPRLAQRARRVMASQQGLYSGSDSDADELPWDSKDPADEPTTGAASYILPIREVGERPKGKLSAYLIFSNVRRPSLIDDHPGLQADVIEQGRLLGAEWRDMTDAEKAPYYDRAAVDAERFADEQEEYLQECEEAAAEKEAHEAAYGRKRSRGGGGDSDDDSVSEQEEGDTDSDGDFRLKTKQSTGFGAGKRKSRRSTGGAKGKRQRRASGSKSAAAPRASRSRSSASAGAQLSPDADYAAKWEYVLSGSGSETGKDGGRGLKSKKTDVVEVRDELWKHRDLLLPGIRQPVMALENGVRPAGKAQDTDPELLRSMLAEMLLWCAPTSSPAVVVRSTKAYKAAGGSGGEVGSLEPGDFVTLDTGDNRGGGVQGGWSPVKPLYFCRNDSKQRRQWVSRAGSRKIGWVAQNDSADQPPPLRSCMGSPRTLDSIAAAATGALGNESAKERKAAGLRAAELLHGWIRGLALSDGLPKTAQSALLLVCDMLRGSSSAVATTKLQKSAGNDVPVPKAEMQRAFEWTYGRIDLIGLGGKRYITKASLIKAMCEHPELKAAYVKRHAHKRQYLSSWAKAKVEHCMNIEIRPWLTANFEKGSKAKNKWIRILDVEDPLIERLNHITDKHAAARKKDVKNKWWYAVVHPTKAGGKVTNHD